MSFKVKLLLLALGMIGAACLLSPFENAVLYGTAAIFIIGVIFTFKPGRAAKGLYFLPFYKDRWLSKQGNLKFYGKYDKLEHAFFYVPLVYAVMALLYWFNLGPEYKVSAAILAFVLGLAKEIYDGTAWAMNRPADSILKGNGFSWKDLAANIIGIGVMVILCLILSY